jgi:hypothetical protein
LLLLTLMSYDEPKISRWMRKVHIGKGYVTTRDKYMRCEKLSPATTWAAAVSCFAVRRAIETCMTWRCRRIRLLLPDHNHRACEADSGYARFRYDHGVDSGQLCRWGQDQLRELRMVAAQNTISWIAS